ncbi:VOC family protein [Paenibacillus psychroresistens]|uniref:VOC family protein n=1 Tax=Paenibacillus psychroresistens TaxID=1778678 RepID=A0A6B8RVE0_9BACL|nr:VOC family protein [Paenibacillus psychroresistens]QGQ99246.1 VOC family protein [Paenibacillus psychroresistens]
MTHPIHPQTSIGAVYLKVSDLERSAQFYQDVVGFRVLSENELKVELTTDGRNPLLVLEKIPNAVVLPRKNTTGLYHFAILVPTRNDLSLSVRNLIKHNLHVGQADHLVSEALYIADPENNGIEIYVDRPRNEWTYNENGEIKMAVDPIEWQGLIDEAGDAEWSGLAEGTVMGHIHLHVADLKATEQFYVDILGFKIMAHMANSALFLSAGGYHHHLGMNVWAGVGAPQPPDNAAGLRYYTIVLPDKAALEEVLNKLRIADISVEPSDEGWFVQDPSKNKILLVSQV